MKLINEKSCVSLERSLKMDSSSPSKPLLRVGLCEAGAVLFTVSRMSDSTAHSPRRGNSPCSMLMNMHPLNGLCTVLSPLPLSASLPAPHLAALTLLPAVFHLTHPLGNTPGLGRLCTPRESFYLTGRKIRPE